MKSKSSREIVKDYLESTSIKGVPKVVKSPTICHRTTWFFVVLFGASVASYQIVQLVRLRMMFSVVTSIEEITDNEIPFPDITLCNLSPIPSEYTWDYIEYANNFLDRYYELIDLVSNTSLSDELLHEIELLFGPYGYKQNLTSKERNTLIIESSTLELPCKWYMNQKATGVDCHPFVKSTYLSAELGLCFTLNADNITRQQSDLDAFVAIIYLDDFSFVNYYDYEMRRGTSHASGILLFVHPPHTPPHTQLSTMLPPGHHASVKIESSMRTRLPPPYTNCENVASINDSEPPINGNAYNKEMCFTICLQNKLISKCDCVSGRLYHTEEMLERYSYCGRMQSNITKHFQKINCSVHTESYFKASDCQCPLACQEIVYSLSVSQTKWPHYSYHLPLYTSHIRYSTFSQKFAYYEYLDSLVGDENESVIYRDVIKNDLISNNFLQLSIERQRGNAVHFKDKPELSWETFVGSFGGTLNLWIGITFITFIEIAELLYNLLTSVLFQKPVVVPAKEDVIGKPKEEQANEKTSNLRQLFDRLTGGRGISNSNHKAHNDNTQHSHSNLSVSWSCP